MLTDDDAERQLDLMGEGEIRRRLKLMLQLDAAEEDRRRAAVLAAQARADAERARQEAEAQAEDERTAETRAAFIRQALAEGEYRVASSEPVPAGGPAALATRNSPLAATKKRERPDTRVAGPADAPADRVISGGLHPREETLAEIERDHAPKPAAPPAAAPGDWAAVPIAGALEEIGERTREVVVTELEWYGVRTLGVLGEDLADTASFTMASLLCDLGRADADAVCAAFARAMPPRFAAHLRILDSEWEDEDEARETRIEKANRGSRFAHVLSADMSTLDMDLVVALHARDGARGRWEELIVSGADNNAIKMEIGVEWKDGPSGRCIGEEGYATRGGREPAFWAKSVPRGEPTLAGRPLLDAVRRLLVIPERRAPDVAGSAQDGPSPRSGEYRVSSSESAPAGGPAALATRNSPLAATKKRERPDTRVAGSADAPADRVISGGLHPREETPAEIERDHAAKPATPSGAGAAPGGWAARSIAAALDDDAVGEDMREVAIRELDFYEVTTLKDLSIELSNGAFTMASLLCDLKRAEADAICEAFVRCMPPEYGPWLRITDDEWDEEAAKESDRLEPKPSEGPWWKRHEGCSPVPLHSMTDEVERALAIRLTSGIHPEAAGVSGVKYWEERRRAGASDEEIVAGFQDGGIYPGAAARARGEPGYILSTKGRAPRFWLGPDYRIDGRKTVELPPSLKGQALIDAARRVLAIPLPKAPDVAESAQDGSPRPCDEDEMLRRALDLTGPAALGPATVGARILAEAKDRWPVDCIPAEVILGELRRAWTTVPKGECQGFEVAVGPRFRRQGGSPDPGPWLEGAPLCDAVRRVLASGHAPPAAKPRKSDPRGLQKPPAGGWTAAAAIVAAGKVCRTPHPSAGQLKSLVVCADCEAIMRRPAAGLCACGSTVFRSFELHAEVIGREAARAPAPQVQSMAPAGRIAAAPPPAGVGTLGTLGTLGGEYRVSSSESGPDGGPPTIDPAAPWSGSGALPASRARAAGPIPTEDEIDRVIRASLTATTGNALDWEGLAKAGATDRELRQTIDRSWPRTLEHYLAEGGLPRHTTRGTAGDPALWIGKYRPRSVPTLGGPVLVDRVRRVMGVALVKEPPPYIDLAEDGEYWDEASLRDAARHLDASPVAGAGELSSVIVCNRCEAARHRRVHPCPSCGNPEYRLASRVILEIPAAGKP